MSETVSGLTASALRPFLDVDVDGFCGAHWCPKSFAAHRSRDPATPHYVKKQYASIRRALAREQARALFLEVFGA